MPDENADIYENRLAARLVDHIRLYLQVRLARLADIRRMLGQISDHASGAASGHHWRRDRLYALWAEAIQDDAAADVAVHTQARLDALYGAAGRSGGGHDDEHDVLTALLTDLDVPRALSLAVERGGVAARTVVTTLGLG